MKRRDFLKSTLPAAALLQTGIPFATSQGELVQPHSQTESAYDLIVIGGGLSGCFAALHAARKGWKVALIERRTFLGVEITATMRPWLGRDGFAALSAELRELFLPDEELGEVAVSFDPADAESFFGDEIPLFLGTVEKQLMRILVQQQVDVLVGTGVWGVLADESQETATGVAVASKFGLQIVHGQQIIDSRIRPLNPASQPGTQVAYGVELYGVSPDPGSEISVPDSLNLLQNKVYLHKGKRRPGQRFLEFCFNPSQEDIEAEARQLVERVCAHLIQNHKSFAKANLMQMAWETLSVTSDRTVAPAPTYRNLALFENTPSFTLSCREVTDLWQQTQELVERLIVVQESDIQPGFIDCDSKRIPLDQCQIAPIDDGDSNGQIGQLTFPFAEHLPKAGRTDVLIAGGGTAGAMAAYGSAQEGARTVTVEYLPELGGTSTLGRVTGYYWGHKGTGFFDLIEDGVQRQSRLAGRCARGVARMLYYRKLATEAGGQLLTGAITCGVVKDKQKVTGLVVEKAGRLFIIPGGVIVDATGDGDVTAFAGAQFTVGDRRMQCTQNYSQWDVNPGMAAWKDSSTNRDHDILWSHRFAEWQRGYRLSHQRAHYYDFTPFLTVRESRRITGEYTITLKDIIRQRRYPDTICLAESDFDPHYFGDTVFTRVGCLLPHQVSAVVEIPYRAILPREIDNLLISAKAISQTHNALQFTRMSFDIMTLGYVTGRIAASIAKQGIEPREFDVTSLYPELRDLKILPPAAPENTAATNQSEAESVQKCVEELIADKPNSLLSIMMHSPEVSEPRLREAYEAADRESQKLRLAKGLAWCGNPAGNTLILNEMKGLFRQEQAAGKLPREYYREDAGSPYWPINQDIALLALSGDTLMLGEILELADSLPLGNPPVVQTTVYNQGRIDLRLVPFYNRLITLCFAIGRMPDERAVRTLNRFLDDPFIRDQVTGNPAEASDKIYGGILESRLAATLARCGSRRGFSILTEYLNDVHPMLASYAGRELRSITGADLECDYRQSKNHLDRLAFPREVVNGRSDEALD